MEICNCVWQEKENPSCFLGTLLLGGGLPVALFIYMFPGAPRCYRKNQSKDKETRRGGRGKARPQGGRIRPHRRGSPHPSPVRHRPDASASETALRREGVPPSSLELGGAEAASGLLVRAPPRQPASAPLPVHSSPPPRGEDAAGSESALRPRPATTSSAMDDPEPQFLGTEADFEHPMTADAVKARQRSLRFVRDL